MDSSMKKLEENSAAANALIVNEGDSEEQKATKQKE